jgi:phosphomethylpyrimidine synthase
LGAVRTRKNMRTQSDEAQRGTITPQIRAVARTEGLDPEKLCEWIAAGSAVIMQRSKRYTGIGKDLSTKVNVNLGTSSTKVCLDDEIQKAKIAETFGADTIRSLHGRGH